MVNRIQSGSWQHRCMGAGLQQNLGAQWTLKTWSEMTASQPNAIFEKVTPAASKKAERDHKRKAIGEAKTTRRQRNTYVRIIPWLHKRHTHDMTVVLSLSEACDTIETFCLAKEQCDDGTTFKLKQRHDYYYQIQCQLYCDNKQ